MPGNYYKILGLTDGASLRQVKKAYRRLALQYHPDIHPDKEVAGEKMKELNQAHTVLLTHLANKSNHPKQNIDFDNDPEYAWLRTQSLQKDWCGSHKKGVYIKYGGFIIVVIFLWGILYSALKDSLLISSEADLEYFDPINSVPAHLSILVFTIILVFISCKLRNKKYIKNGLRLVLYALASGYFIITIMLFYLYNEFWDLKQYGMKDIDVREDFYSFSILVMLLCINLYLLMIYKLRKD